MTSVTIGSAYIRQARRVAQLLMKPPKNWLSAPTFDDPELSRIAGLLNALLLVNLAVLVPYMLLVVLTTSQPTGIVLTLLIIVSGVTALLVILRRGFVTQARLAYIAFAWFASSFAVVITGGITGPATFAYVIFVAIAALVQGSRAAVNAAFSSTITIWALYGIEQMGWLPPPLVEGNVSGLDRVLNYTVFVVIAGAMLAMAMQGLERTMRALRLENEKRERYEHTLQLYSEQLEAMVDERTAALDEARAHAQRQDRLALLGKLGGSIGHELRNPLGVIKNAVFYLKLTTPDPTPQTTDYLNMIESRVNDAERIVDDLLGFARNRQPTRQPVAVRSVVEAAIERFPVPDHCALRLDIASDLAALIDPLHLTQVFNNLISNAWQAMPDGGTLTIAAHGAGDHITVTVCDEGHGIPPEMIEQIFEPLVSTRARGIGLGLAISRTLIEANGGSIHAANTAHGACFTVTLPPGNNTE